MTLRRYPTYVPSGVEALGPVPAHWAVFPLKRELAFLTSGSRGWAEHYADEGDLFIRIANLTRDSACLDLRDVQFVRVPDGAEGERTRVQPGDVLFSITAYLGSVAVVPTNIGPAYVSQHIALARLRNRRLLPHWLGYFTQSIVGSRLLELAGYGGTKVQLSLDDIANLPVPVPPLDDQLSTVVFLDRETAKIDALIAEQEKLIALLAEKRQATISHAVTRGLDPDVPMKDSGVAWLGEVPIHWRVLPLKLVVSTPITDGPHETPQFLDEGVPFVSAEAVSGGVVNFEKIRGYISEADHRRYSLKYKPQCGDVYMVKSGATTGVTAIVETDREFNIWSPLAAIRCDRNVADPYFILMAMRSRNFQESVALHWTFGTQQNIGMGSLGDLPVALPPIAEQREIVELLTRSGKAIEELRIDSQSAIELLRERRSALITAAVTGQIDVRGLVADTASRPVARERVLG